MAGTVAEFLFMFEVHALTVPRIILKDFKSSPLKFLVCLEQIRSIFSVIFWALLYPKDIKKKFRVDHFNRDHFKVMLLKTICNDDF